MMKRTRVINAVLVVGLIVMLGVVAGCGGTSSNTCDCEICVNEEPAYPCDSAASCATFAADQGCNSHQYLNSATDTCGGEPQPICRVSDCSAQCQCPGI